MAVPNSCVLDLSLRRDETENEAVENSDLPKQEIMENNAFDNDQPQDFSMTRATNAHQEMRKNIPLISPALLKRKGPQIEPYVPSAPQPKVRRQLPPPLVTCVNQSFPNVGKNVNLQFQLKVSSAQSQSPSGINITSQNSNVQTFIPLSMQQSSTGFRFSPTTINNSIQPRPPVNPYSIAGVTPLISRPPPTRTVAPARSLAPTSPNPALIRPSNLQIGQRFLVPSPKPPIRYATNQLPTGAVAKPPLSQNVPALSTSTANTSPSQPQSSSGMSLAANLEEMPRHNNPFMHPVGKQEPLKQTRVAFRNSPEFSLVHVQHASPQSNSPNKAHSAFPHIMPKQVRPGPPGQVIRGGAINVSSASVTNRPAPDLQPSPKGPQLKPTFIGSPIRPQVHTMRPVGISQPFHPGTSQQQQITINPVAPKTTQNSGSLQPGRLNILGNPQLRRPLFQNPGNLQVVATPIPHGPPQISRAGPMIQHFRPRTTVTSPRTVIPTTPTATPFKDVISSASRGLQPCSVPSTKFFNPPSGVKPLVPKPVPSSQLIAQQQKLASQMSATLTPGQHHVSTGGNSLAFQQQLNVINNVNAKVVSSAATFAVSSSINSSPSFSSSVGGIASTSNTLSTVRVLNPSRPASFAHLAPPPLIKMGVSQTPTCGSKNLNVFKEAANNVNSIANSINVTQTNTFNSPSKVTWTLGKSESPIATTETAAQKMTAAQDVETGQNCEVGSPVVKLEDLKMKVDIEANVEKLLKIKHFNWSAYLKESMADCAGVNGDTLEVPHSSFTCVKAIRRDDLPEGAVIELPSRDDNECWWVGAIVYSCQQNLVVRFAGFSDPSGDVWLDLEVNEVHSIGWCHRNGKRLEPPPHFPLDVLKEFKCDSSDVRVKPEPKENDSVIEERDLGEADELLVETERLKKFLTCYLVNRVSVSEKTIEERLYWPLESRIPIGARFEFEHEPRKVWLVKVVTNNNGLLMLHYEGVPDEVTKHDFLSFFTSKKIHPVGFAIKSFDTAMEPPGLLSDYLPSQAQIENTYQQGFLTNEKLRILMPSKFFTQTSCYGDQHMSKSEETSWKYLSLKEHLQTKLEVIFSKFPHLVCVGTVVGVENESSITVCLDDCSEETKRESLLSETFSLDSFNLLPALWCEQHGIELTPPLNYSTRPHTFSWYNYLTQRRRRCFPRDSFRASRKNLPESEFKPGRKMEIINPLCPKFISPCTVVKSAGRVLQIELDGWATASGEGVRIFVDSESDALFPARWAHSVNCPHFLPSKRCGSDSGDTFEICKSEEQNVVQELVLYKRVKPDDYKVFEEVPPEAILKQYHSNITDKFWCPAVYVNYRCCKDPIFSRYQLSCLSRHFGPGLSIYVIRSLLNALILCSNKPFQVFREIIGICSHFDSVAYGQAYIKAKFKTKNLHAFVKIPELFSDFEDFIQTVLRKLGCCENLFTIREYTLNVCNSAECQAGFTAMSSKELTECLNSDTVSNGFVNKSRGVLSKTKKRKKKKILFSNYKRVNATNAKSGSPSLGKKEKGGRWKGLGSQDSNGPGSDTSLPGSRPLTPHSESPVDTTNLGKLITVEPKRGFVKLKKGISVHGINTTNPPEREKSKRHKSVFSTVNMIAKSEMDLEEFMIQTSVSPSQLIDKEFRPISPAEKDGDTNAAEEVEAALKLELKTTSADAVETNKKEKTVAKNNKRRPQASSQKGSKPTKLRKTSQASSNDSNSQPERSNSRNKRLKDAPRSPKRCTRAANPLQKSDPLKWSTEELCLHLNTTECADFITFIRKENIDGQSFLLLNFNNLVELCEVRKDLALKVCYQVAKLKKQYLHVSSSSKLEDSSNSSGFGEA